MNRIDFQSLSDLRIADARALLEAGRFGGAFYFTGIAIECGLKAAIAKQTAAHDFPPKPELVRSIYVHSLGDLLKHALLDQQLDRDCIPEPELRRNWDVVKSWTVEARYSSVATEQTARDMFSSASDIKTGVLTWLKIHW